MFWLKTTHDSFIHKTRSYSFRLVACGYSKYFLSRQTQQQAFRFTDFWSNINFDMIYSHLICK